MNLTRIDRHRLADRVTEQLLDLLDRRVVRVGEKFPSERELARSLGVSRPLVRESIRTLQSMGLVEVKHGVGAIVIQNRSSGDEEGEPSGNGDLNLLESPDSTASYSGDSIRAISRLELATILDILEAREVLEVQIVELASRRIRGEEAEWLRAAARSQSETWNDNREFHVMLASITHNFMLERLVAMQLDLLHDARQRQHYTFPRQATHLLDEHGDIAEAVIAGDVERAMALMKTHFKNTRRLIVQDNVSSHEAE